MCFVMILCQWYTFCYGYAHFNISITKTNTRPSTPAINFDLDAFINRSKYYYRTRIAK